MGEWWWRWKEGGGRGRILSGRGSVMGGETEGLARWVFGTWRVERGERVMVYVGERKKIRV